MARHNPLQVTAEPGKQEFFITRSFDAPRDLVFKAFTDPEAIPQWWGPRYLTTQVDKMEVKPGGMWRFLQRDPQGNEFGFHGVYHAIQAPARIVQTFEFEGEAGHVALETTTFEERDGITTMKSHSVFESVEDRDGMIASGMEKGVVDSYERLDDILATPQNARK